MAEKLIFSIPALFIFFLFLLSALQGYQLSLDSSGHLDKKTFRKLMSILTKFALILFLGAFIYSLIAAALLYRGKCWADYVAPTDKIYDCSFSQFYIRSTLRGFFTGNPYPYAVWGQ